MLFAQSKNIKYYLKRIVGITLFVPLTEKIPQNGLAY